MNLIILCSILRLWNNQITGQYENCDVMREFLRTLRFEVSKYVCKISSQCMQFFTGFLKKLTKMIIKI